MERDLIGEYLTQLRARLLTSPRQAQLILDEAEDHLRESVAADPKLRVLIVHGWNDLSCPFMGSVLSVDQMPIMGDAGRVQVHEFPGGHMFYTRTGNQEALHKLAETMVETH